MNDGMYLTEKIILEVCQEFMVHLPYFQAIRTGPWADLECSRLIVYVVVISSPECIVVSVDS